MPLNLLIGAAALALFLGMRERLRRIMRLHSALVLQLAELAALLDRRRATMQTLEEHCQVHLRDARAPLEAMARARRASSEAAARLGRQPTDVDALAALSRSEVDLTRGLALLVTEASLQGIPANLHALLSELDSMHGRLLVQSSSFDRATQAYNDLRSRPPASWMAKLWGMHEAHALCMG